MLTYLTGGISLVVGKIKHFLLTLCLCGIIVFIYINLLQGFSQNMDPLYINKLQTVYNKLSELIVSVDNKSPNKGLGMNSRNLVDLTFTAHNRQIMEQHITQFHPGMAHRFVTT
jgi:low affinity Fe/Cu permease